MIERILGQLFQPFLEMSGAYGINQFAYTSLRGYKDVLALNVLSWIFAMNCGLRVAVYCSDVSGAFDRVSSGRLVRKLQAKGIHPQMLKVLRSWLRERKSFVIVDGVASEQYALLDSVFQGTVWGPPLWNCYYEDARLAITGQGFSERIFADDLMAFKAFDREVPTATVTSRLQQCQTELHMWGKANQVLFDPTKESFHILHQRNPWGPSFKSLGVTFDVKLVMGDACMEIAAQGNCRLNTLLRTRRFHTVESCILLYKSQVLSYVESGTPAVYHAPRFFLSAIDRVQGRLLDALGLSLELAIIGFNLAPLSSRRDIAMLGLIHRVVLGFAPEQFSDYIRPARAMLNRPREWRSPGSRHNKQLHDAIDGTNSAMMSRSLFGLVNSYNLLPQAVVDAKTTRAFQRCLQRGVKRAATNGVTDWERLLSTGARRLPVGAFQDLFR